MFKVESFIRMLSPQFFKYKPSKSCVVFGKPQSNTPLTYVRGVFWYRELTMTYSHMGEPHYHWRIGVSLLSSGRDQVGPPSYYRQQRGIEE